MATPKGEFRVEDPSYETIHARLFYTYGRASERVCGRCGKQALQWAYDHSDPDEKVDPKGRPYSYDLERYTPLCVKCHRAVDNPGTCRNGHAWTTENTYHSAGKRFCRQCRREYMREYRRRTENG